MITDVTPTAYTNYTKGKEMPAPKQQEKTQEAAQAEQVGTGAELTPGTDAPSPRYDEYIHEEEGMPKEEKDALPDTKSEVVCTVNTDKVDAEIKSLKEKKAQIEQQIIKAEDNTEQQYKLERQLQQIENELRAKDNDSYRRQHAEYK
ncbi:hypothetical protein [Extibacter muris]|uniref:hypothetical protein n=1 Tax=Extibacter muris TaxID=1796622 RepID=UPI001D062A3B|nr:hypothetical protein [Extibacter muris]MCB6202478.1 hypothetical protein [Extibacter muris]MCQ4664897.1 hypothetical protein [Extibacter muris]MCQ4694262.1 hypothetical protein [Extibacter muris]